MLELDGSSGDDSFPLGERAVPAVQKVHLQITPSPSLAQGNYASGSRSQLLMVYRKGTVCSPGVDRAASAGLAQSATSGQQGTLRDCPPGPHSRGLVKLASFSAAERMTKKASRTPHSSNNSRTRTFNPSALLKKYDHPRTRTWNLLMSTASLRAVVVKRLDHWARQPLL
ncbi:hypothetical protein PGT21_008055 [Puccinia graminis f. sp. tritici]|uniref:Uncharacterized protein n=1 Tax=Puccinia graminis f. sp. tritici TaxID=56615 RepID=A0A5B0R0C3_PUCGR|nr:hypothetical protein PGT21_008055 [Puccinia graminis f. sp. tritici]KAA1135452.1 hypothetical protein PGTUg99_026141 [Puccinia graminis f. sp. tritici]